MAGPIAIDTPDYQRGIVSAQKLLGFGGPFDTHIAVGIPPNAETLIVTFGASIGDVEINCVGATTGTTYPGVLTAAVAGVSAGVSAMFDVSSVTDEQVTVQLAHAPGVDWFVYADSGVHLTADVSKRIDSSNCQAVVPVPPNTGSQDHPPTELQLASILDAVNGTVLVAAPGAGTRIRVFDAFVNASSTTTFVALRTSVTAVQVVGVSANAANTAGHISCLPSGCPLPGGEGINLIASAGSVDGTVTYTVETI